MREKKKNLDKKLLAYSVAAGATLACSAEGAFIFEDLGDFSLSGGSSIPFSFEIPGATPVGFGLLLFNYGSEYIKDLSPPKDAHFTEGKFPIKYHEATNILEMRVLNVNTKSPYNQSAGIRLGSPSFTKGVPKGAALNFGNNVAGPKFADDALLGYRFSDKADLNYNFPNFVIDTTITDFYGNFDNVTNKYIGLKVRSGGTFFYGWIRVSTNSDLSSVTVHDWAYENTGVEIAAGEIPEPGNLGLLAAGAAGLMAWRRRRRENTKDHADTVPEKA